MKICVVCFANYCRSPVAERILKKKYSPNHHIISAGLAPMYAGQDMDPRSKDYLMKNNYDFSNHLPRKISAKIINDFDLILALDIFILMQLNKNFAKSKEKIKILTYQDPKIILNDPYNFNINDYKEVMQNIEKICLDINF